MAVGFRAASTAGNVGTTITVTKPAGTASGDLLLAFMSCDPDGSVAALTAPAGWTQATPDGSSVGQPFARVFYKVAGGAEPASYVFGSPNVSASDAACAVLAFTAADTTSPIQVGPSWAYGTGSPAVAPSVTATGGGMLVCGFSSDNSSSAAASWTAPAGMTERVDAAPGTWIGLGVSTQTVSAGALGTRSSAHAPVVTAAVWSAMSLVVRDAVTIVDQTADDAFTLTDDATQEVEALGQAGDDTATVDDTATMDIVSQGFDAADDGTLSDDAAMLVVGQSFAATDTGVVDDSGDMLIVGQSFTVSDAATVTDAGSLRIVDSRAVLGTRALHVDFWLLDDAGEYVCPLPHVVGFSLSMIAGEPGTVNLEYAAAGINYGQLRDAVTRRRDALIAIRIDGTDATSLRARLNSRNEDRIAETGVVSFGGHFLTRRLREIVVGYQPATEKGELSFAAATAGQIMGTALLQAQARGTGTELSFSFTNTHDSNGLPWPLQTSVQISPGMKLLDLAAKLREWGMAETEVTSALEVRMYVPESVGIDWSLGDRPVILRRGRDLTEATGQVSSEDAPTDLLLAGNEGLYEEIFDATARAERGRQIEDYDSQGNLADAGSLAAYGELELGRRGEGTESNTFALSCRPDQALPLRDLHVSDWVLADTGEGLGTSDRIMQLTVERQSGNDFYSGSVVVNDLLAELDVLLSRRIDGLIGGATIAGTSAASPAVDDGLAPNVPAGLGAISLAYYDGTNPKATLQASWAPVITNSDGSPISDLSGYEVQYRYGTGQGLPTDWVTLPRTSNTSATTDGLTQGLVVDVRVRAVDRFDRDSAWSGLYTLITASDADAPPTPSTPVVESYLGILTFAWDGKGSAGEDLPGDFSHVEIHASQVADFTPDRPVLADGTLDAAASSTYIDRLTGAGTMPSTIGTYGDTWFGKLVAVDRTGNASPASAQDSAVLVQAGDGDLSALNVGKLTSGLMTAFVANLGMIYGGTRGAASYELDPAGLRFYDANHNMTIELNRANASAFLTGTMQTGRTGRRIKLDGATNDIIFYPQAGETRLGRIRSFIPSNYPNDISIAVEASDSDTLNIRGRLEIRPDVAILATVLQADDTIAPSIVAAEYRRVFMATRNDASVDFARLDMQEDTVTLEMRASGARDGGFLWLSRGSTGSTIFGRRTTTIDKYISFGSAQTVLADTSNTFLSLDPTRFRVALNGTAEFDVNAAGVNASTYGSYQAANGYRAVLITQGGPEIMFYWAAGALQIGNNASGAFIKTFVIDHPDDPSKHLVHATTEGPVAGVEYTGTATIVDHEAWVELPAYFESLTSTEDRTVQLTIAESDAIADVPHTEVPLDDDVYGPSAISRPMTPAWGLIPSVLAGRVRDGRFRIVCSGPDGTRVHWLVKAVRKDVAQFDVEPAKARGRVRGDGPYTYYVPNEESA